MTTNTITILLVEDNPGDARLIREMIGSAEQIQSRMTKGFDTQSLDSDDIPWRDVEGELVSPSVVHRTRLDEGLAALKDGEVDIVLLDLNLPDSVGLDTLEAVIDHDPTVPVVVLTGVQDREVGLEALDIGSQEYLVKDEINADLLVRTIVHAIQRAGYERALARQLRRVTTLNQVGVTLLDVGGSLINRTSQETLESAVCDRLASSEVYSSPWIGSIDRETVSVTPRVSAAPEGFLDEWNADADAAETVREAIVEREIRVRRVHGGDSGDTGLERHAAEYEYRSFAAIPLEYEGALYGVLVVYSDRPRAFEAEETRLLEQLGPLIGHAINAIERKTALMSESVIQLDLFLPGLVEEVIDDSHDGGTIEFLATVPKGDREFLQYAVVEHLSDESVEAMLGRLAEHESLEEVEASDSHRLVEIEYHDHPIVSVLAEFGGRFRSASFEDGDYTITVEVPDDTDVRSFLDSIRSHLPGLNLVAQRSVELESPSSTSRFRTSESELTDKQRAALEAAYFSGYFNQPRTSRGTEIAESLGITASTFHQHLQTGLRKVLASELENSRRIPG